MGQWRNGNKSAGMEMKSGHSKAMIARLSRYLRGLEDHIRQGCETISSRALGEQLGISDAQVRKDFAAFNRLGYAGIGYRCADLIQVIRDTLGINRAWRAAIVGCGNLGQALIGYQGFRQRGFAIEAAFDENPALIGRRLHGLEVLPLRHFAATVRERGIQLAILAVPAEEAQKTGEIIARSGILGILNFAPVNLNLPKSVSVSSVELTIELEQLVFAVVQKQIVE